MNVQASDLSARLLATENLSVVRANTRTASFDIKSRVLTLPMWKDMTTEIEDMLVGHEVGHALYTSEEYIEPIRETPKLMGYMNILEDVRIEKLIKRKYPGLRKRMNEGYKQLNERDFFGVKSVQNFEDLLLIDRINLYFKVGFQCGVTFSPDERVFVNRAERTETVEEVIQLAKDVFAFAKQQAEQRKQKQIESGESSEDEEDEDPTYTEFDDIDMGDPDEWSEEEGDDSDGGASKHYDEVAGEKEDDIESKTDSYFQKKLEDLADGDTQYVYYNLDSTTYDEVVVGYKQILEDTKTEFGDRDDSKYSYRFRHMSNEEWEAWKNNLKTEYDKFMVDTTRTVNYLVKEFEMKKSAQLYKRAQTSKIGSLDMRKVYAYKLQDDLFKRVTTLPQGKNHGMVMLLDWSGSMDGVIKDTIKQVINLAMFCRRIQIPFHVYAFSTQYGDKFTYHNFSEKELQARRDKRIAYHKAKQERVGDWLDAGEHFNLLELFSHKMSLSEFNTMARRLLDDRFTWNDGYSLGGTPLNESLIWMYDHLGEFLKRNNIEKSTLITLTDGEGSSIHSNNGRMDSYRVVYEPSYKRVRTRHFVRDDITKKQYEFTNDATQQTETLLRMIKDRYSITTVGFYICSNTKRALNNAIRANIPAYQGSTETLIEAWRKSFRSDKFVSVKNTGRDELFLIPQDSTKISDEELKADSDMKASALAKNFTKYLNMKKTSRVLLNRFVGLVA